MPRYIPTRGLCFREKADRFDGQGRVFLFFFLREKKNGPCTSIKLNVVAAGRPCQLTSITNDKEICMLSLPIDRRTSARARKKVERITCIRLSPALKKRFLSLVTSMVSFFGGSRSSISCAFALSTLGSSFLSVWPHEPNQLFWRVFKCFCCVIRSANNLS